jgi:tetraacyldisaccharide 4'-kinase
LSNNIFGLGFLSRLAALFYEIGARLHRWVMKKSAPARGRLGCAVISVGGVTAGGAGKTPIAARLAYGLSRNGRRVVLASRGYRGATRDSVTVVSDGRYVRSNVEAAGDEALVLAAHAPGVPVLVGRDRRVVGHYAVSVFDAEILVLDDGFQHHRLARDLDIVCLDGGTGLGNGRLLPAGPLREPLAVLGEADWLCVVDGNGREEVTKEALDQASKSAEVMRAHRRPVELVHITDKERRLPVDALGGQRVGLLAGIARPESLRRTLEDLGAEVVFERTFRDHHAYRERDLQGLEESVDFWVTTEKDALKILPRWIEAVDLWILRIEAEIEDEQSVLERLDERLRALGRLR